MRFRRLFRFPHSASRVAAELDDELAFHLDQRIDELVATGMTPDAARAEAMRRFGDLDDARRYCEEIDRTGARVSALREWLAGWRQDLGFTARQMRTQPGFTAIAALTLALGIGANTAIFSVLNHLVLHPLPYPEAERLVMLFRSQAKLPVTVPPSAGDVRAWQARAHTIQHLEGVSVETHMLETAAGSEELPGFAVTPGLTRMLGTQPILGRAFTVADAAPGAAPVVILNYGYWQERLGGESRALGQTLRLDDKVYTVIGVMPKEFDLASIAGMRDSPGRVLLPSQLVADTAQRFASMIPVSRLMPGATVEQAQRELAAIQATSDQPKADLNGWVVRVQLPVEMRSGSFRTGLFVLLGAVALVLLIACANVANLLLTRALGRQREFAIRAALGAGRARLARQLFTESGALAVLGGVLGLIVAWLGLRGIIAVRPPRLDALDGVRLEPLVLGWTLGITLLTGLFFGIAPVLQSAGRSGGDALRSGARGGQSRSARRFRSALVMIEIALSVVLIVGAGLLVRSMMRLQRVDLGFDPDHLVTMAVAVGPAAGRYSPEGTRRTALLTDALVERVRHIPGVLQATAASAAPPAMGVIFGSLQAEGDEKSSGDKPTALPYFGIHPDYFAVMRIALNEGRTFLPNEKDGIVVNRSMARRLWHGQPALGRRLRLSADGDWHTVIGVAADVSVMGPMTSDFENSQLYLLADTTTSASTVVVRTKGEPAEIVPVVRKELAALDRSAALSEVKTTRTAMAATIARPRFNTTLLTIFAGLALMLAAIGLYGVISFTVSQRTREIGVRMALGAEAGAVRRLVVGQGLALTVAGVAVGLLASAAATRALRSMLFEVQPIDPATFAFTAVMLVGVAIAATYAPARRATMVDPAVALRGE